MIEIWRKLYANNNNNNNNYSNNNKLTEMENFVMETEKKVFCSPTEVNNVVDKTTTKENLSPCNSIENGHKHKRQRRKSTRNENNNVEKSSLSNKSFVFPTVERVKNAPEQVFLDEIYDAVRVLYGISVWKYDICSKLHVKKQF